VDSIVPLELDRCITRLEGDKKRRDRQARWQKVAREAARQCGRLKMPEVSLPMDVGMFLRLVSERDMLLIPWEEGGRPLKDFLAWADAEMAAGAWNGGKVFVMIGPEGGMTAGEVEAGRRAGGHVLTLGPRLLRTETAGMALLSILQCQWGDMG
jgi:16S rRNA (uracil1498-N3)-methyltransferase